MAYCLERGCLVLRPNGTIDDFRYAAAQRDYAGFALQIKLQVEALSKSLAFLYTYER